jgi:hypothetical protein
MDHKLESKTTYSFTLSFVKEMLFAKTGLDVDIDSVKVIYPLSTHDTDTIDIIYTEVSSD